MGALLYPSIEVANKEFDLWWKTNKDITVVRFRDHLRKKYSEFEWTHLWVSRFIYEKDLYVVDNSGLQRIYSKKNIFEEKFKHSVQILKTLKADITKSNIKRVLNALSINFTTEEFDKAFAESNLKWLGFYNNENHKIYTYE